MQEKLEKAQMLVMPDIEDPFVPLGSDGLFVDPYESKSVYRFFKLNQDTDRLERLLHHYLHSCQLCSLRSRTRNRLYYQRLMRRSRR